MLKLLLQLQRMNFYYNKLLRNNRRIISSFFLGNVSWKLQLYYKFENYFINLVVKCWKQIIIFEIECQCSIKEIMPEAYTDTQAFFLNHFSWRFT